MYNVYVDLDDRHVNADSIGVEISVDERTQSRDECRSRGECRTGDAETRGRAEGTDDA